MSQIKWKDYFFSTDSVGRIWQPRKKKTINIWTKWNIYIRWWRVKPRVKQSLCRGQKQIHRKQHRFFVFSFREHLLSSSQTTNALEMKNKNFVLLSLNFTCSRHWLYNTCSHCSSTNISHFLLLMPNISISLQLYRILSYIIQPDIQLRHFSMKHTEF